ncbi:hypothetical protein NX905_21375 [Burkholderia thailandensis]|uniref:hypothetical protein n=1 Tax=Burkholderia thailandensis TaxID=57975 RepID=UPI00217E210E|nr:hypothetical protein [Burkholderia thailandensis]MCS6496799.1 hypothetical protein [Burkholderia thailandensis]
MWKVQILSWLSGEWEDAALGQFHTEKAALGAAQSCGRLEHHQKRVVLAERKRDHEQTRV